MLRFKGASPAIIVGGVIVGIIVAAIVLIVSTIQPTVPLSLGSGLFTARVAYTPSERAKVLDGATSIASNQAFIFAYPSNGQWSVNMSQIKIPIDIVWLSNSNKIVDTAENVKPEPANSGNGIYKPGTAARYVVELAPGTITKKSIRVGLSAILNINSSQVK